jgi:putative membrane protein
MEKIKRNLKQYMQLVFNGFAMGAANVIPGVSGGTMAFILGIYEELIDSIRQFASTNTLKLVLKFKIKELYKTLPWPFLLAVGIGVLVAIASLAKVLSYALDKHPAVTFAFFFGLIIASILTVLKRVKKWSASRVVAMLAGALVAYLIVTLVPVETPHVWWNLFLCGVIIICAMILPGISGSFLLLILGQYKYVLAAVNLLITVPIALLRGKAMPDPDIIFSALLTLFWVISGCVIGLGSFVHFLNWLFKKFHDLTVATLIGFMVGSLWKLWPWQEKTEIMVKAGKDIFRLNLPADSARLQELIASGSKIKIKTLVTENIVPASFDGTFWLAIALAVVGFFMVIIMEKMASGKDEEVGE